MSQPCRVRAWIVAAIALAVLAGCLKMPLGDPEKSKMDPKFTGVWLKRDDDGGVNLWHVQPWDSRTYLVTNYSAKPDGAGGWERGDLSVSKGWITEVKGATFGTIQVLSEGESEKPYAVMRLELTTDSLTARGVKPEFVDDNKVTTEPGLRKLIEENLDNEAMYIQPDKYYKADGPDLETVKAVMAVFR